MPQNSKRSWRILNQDGTFNIERVDRPTDVRHKDLYHFLLTRSWRRFFAFLIASYLGVNLVFGLLYFALGPGAIAGNFPDCFFFSVQTFSTIGYGGLLPHGLLANLVVTVEAFLGLLGIALLTGLIFARFSRPTARVVFSKYAVTTEQDSVPVVMFRIANLRANQIVEARCTVTFVQAETTAEGDRYRTFTDMKLERDRNPMFVLSWTVIHEIDKNSPLYGKSAEQLRQVEAEILVGVSGWDESFAQNIHARYSYDPDDILWKHRFVDIVSRSEKSGKLILDTRRIHNAVPV